MINVHEHRWIALEAVKAWYNYETTCIANGITPKGKAVFLDEFAQSYVDALVYVPSRIKNDMKDAGLSDLETKPKL